MAYLHINIDLNIIVRYYNKIGSETTKILTSNLKVYYCSILFDTMKYQLTRTTR